ncbi:MAG TPA: glycoside hydrolase family 3 N-terminal domain-containing protein [Candidatus Eisenbacteria bacterium]|nr:glycoside hydrolase family 3 N-terminal domain-containing protein [Candidatus Eisenbacteria bacterium]
MASDPIEQRRLLSRREVLRGVAVGSAATLLASCVPAALPSASPSSGAPSPAPSPEPSRSPASPSPSPTVSATPGLSLRQRIASLLVVGFRGLTVTTGDPVAKAIEAGLGGVILFDRHQNSGELRNIESPEQVRTLTADLQTRAGGRPFLVAIDQEGGLVTRLSPKYGFPAVASEAEIGATGDDAAVTTWARGMADTLASAGVNLNLAPVVDLNVNPQNPAIGAIGRAFSADPDVVARYAGIEMQAHRDRGIRTAIKHFPGLGSATANTDFGVSDVTQTWTGTELVPYRSLIGQGLVDVIMTGHLVNGQLDAEHPASLSRATVTGLLRQQLGWDGPVITDDLQAGAITAASGFGEAVALALTAGNDLLLFANQQTFDPDITPRILDLVEQLVQNGTVPEARIDEAVARVARLG